MLDPAVIDAIKEGNGSRLERPIPAIAAFVPLQVAVVPGRLLERGVPVVTVLLQKVAGLGWVVGVDGLYQRCVDVVVPVIDVISIGQQFAQQVFVEGVVPGVACGVDQGHEALEQVGAVQQDAQAEHLDALLVLIEPVVYRQGGDVRNLVVFGQLSLQVFVTVHQGFQQGNQQVDAVAGGVADEDFLEDPLLEMPGPEGLFLRFGVGLKGVFDKEFHAVLVIAEEVLQARSAEECLSSVLDHGVFLV